MQLARRREDEAKAARAREAEQIAVAGVSAPRQAPIAAAVRSAGSVTASQWRTSKTKRMLLNPWLGELGVCLTTPFRSCPPHCFAVTLYQETGNTGLRAANAV